MVLIIRCISTRHFVKLSSVFCYYFQIISFTHTMLHNHKHTKIQTLLVLCPLNTVLNWQDEWEKWVDEEVALDVSVRLNASSFIPVLFSVLEL